VDLNEFLHERLLESFSICKKFDLIYNTIFSNLQISYTQISIRNVILYKNQFKQNNQLIFTPIREL